MRSSKLNQLDEPTSMTRKKFRPDLSDYEIYVESLVDRLNEDSVRKMSKTDAVKMAIEKACRSIIPDVEIKPRRKRYERLNF
jgi:hypothetical protein